MSADKLHDELSELLNSDTTSRSDMLEIAEAQAHVCNPGNSSFLEDLIGEKAYRDWVDLSDKSKQDSKGVKARSKAQSALTTISAPEKQLTLSQAAEILKMSNCNLRRHCMNGTIEATKLGPRAWIISESAIESFKKNFPDDRLRRGRRPGSAASIKADK